MLHENSKILKANWKNRISRFQSTENNLGQKR